MTFRETTVKYIKDILRAKTISEVIYAELQDAHLRKLEAETAAEYAHAAMQYNEERIKRLEARLKEHTKEGDYA
jgi:hypothetical protein